MVRSKAHPLRIILKHPSNERSTTVEPKRFGSDCPRGPPSKMADKYGHKCSNSLTAKQLVWELRLALVRAKGPLIRHNCRTNLYSGIRTPIDS